MFSADANFGILDRDEAIADALIESKQKTGYPVRFDVTYAKGREDIVFRIAQKMFNARMFRGPSVSLQTLNPDALDNIGRRNMTLDSYSVFWRGIEKRVSRVFRDDFGSAR